MFPSFLSRPRRGLSSRAFSIDLERAHFDTLEAESRLTKALVNTLLSPESSQSATLLHGQDESAASRDDSHYQAWQLATLGAQHDAQARVEEMRRLEDDAREGLESVHKQHACNAEGCRMTLGRRRDKHVFHCGRRSEVGRCVAGGRQCSACIDAQNEMRSAGSGPCAAHMVLVEPGMHANGIVAEYVRTASREDLIAALLQAGAEPLPPAGTRAKVVHTSEGKRASFEGRTGLVQGWMSGRSRDLGGNRLGALQFAVRFDDDDDDEAYFAEASLAFDAPPLPSSTSPALARSFRPLQAWAAAVVAQHGGLRAYLGSLDEPSLRGRALGVRVPSRPNQ